MTGGRFDPFSGDGPRWRAVPAWRPFLEDLAAGVLDWLGDAPPETLTDATILLPNRRAARAFSQCSQRMLQHIVDERAGFERVKPRHTARPGFQAVLHEKREPAGVKCVHARGGQVEAFPI